MVVSLESLEELVGPLFNGINRKDLHEFTADKLNAHDCYTNALAKTSILRTATIKSSENIDANMLKRFNFKEAGNFLICTDVLLNGQNCEHSILKSKRRRAAEMLAHCKKHEQYRIDGEPKTVN